jgi:hypothetical protein
LEELFQREDDDQAESAVGADFAEDTAVESIEDSDNCGRFAFETFFDTNTSRSSPRAVLQYRSSSKAAEDISRSPVVSECVIVFFFFVLIFRSSSSL